MNDERYDRPGQKKMALLLLEARVDTNVQQMGCSKARTIEQVAKRLREKSIM